MVEVTGSSLRRKWLRSCEVIERRSWLVGEQRELEDVGYDVTNEVGNLGKRANI